jgi:hypothetical protein
MGHQNASQKNKKRKRKEGVGENEVGKNKRRRTVQDGKEKVATCALHTRRKRKKNRKAVIKELDEKLVKKRRQRFKFDDESNVPVDADIYREGNKRYVFIEGEKTRIFTATAISDRRLKFGDGSFVPFELTDGQEKFNRFVINEYGKKEQVYTAAVYRKMKRNSKFADRPDSSPDAEIDKEAQDSEEKQVITNSVAATEIHPQAQDSEEKLIRTSAFSVFRKKLLITDNISPPLEAQDGEEEHVFSAFKKKSLRFADRSNVSPQAAIHPEAQDTEEMQVFTVNESPDQQQIGNNHFYKSGLAAPGQLFFGDRRQKTTRGASAQSTKLSFILNNFPSSD